MPRSLKIYITGLVALSAIALAVTSLVIPVDDRIALGWSDDSQVDILAGIAFWTVMTLLASALPVQMPRGSLINTSIATLVAAMTLGGPTAAGWVALIGTTEVRELSGRVKWYGTLANHAGLVLPAVLGGLVISAVRGEANPTLSPFVDFVATMAGATAFFALNVACTTITVALRTSQSPTVVLRGDLPTFFANWVALSPLAWLMAFATYAVGWWSTLLFALPVWIMRGALDQIIEMRQMFTQTVASLAQAVDARSDWTSGHSQRVQLISVDIGRVMRRSEKELEALEWGGLLHDIGKIGVPPSILDKPGKLTEEEFAIIRSHPSKGVMILRPIPNLEKVLPIVFQHHERYDGKGYPNGLSGESISLHSRILAVADVVDALLSDRPYRPGWSREKVLVYIRENSGLQFDPTVVEAYRRIEAGRRDGSNVEMALTGT
jgi:putative nucleotidyltransferase with HDIG domain